MANSSTEKYGQPLEWIQAKPTSTSLQKRIQAKGLAKNSDELTRRDFLAFS